MGMNCKSGVVSGAAWCSKSLLSMKRVWCFVTVRQPDAVISAGSKTRVCFESTAAGGYAQDAQACTLYTPSADVWTAQRCPVGLSAAFDGQICHTCVFVTAHCLSPQQGGMLRMRRLAPFTPPQLMFGLPNSALWVSLRLLMGSLAVHACL